jgi:hypothetical protein
MYHWIRDCPVYKKNPSYGNGYGESMYIFYHFLRTAGWSWIWECDGVVDNHCTDASMEAAGVTDWTAVGSVMRSKSTSQKHMLTQSLEVTSMSSGDGVRSAALVSMSAGITYRLTFWAYNNSGQAWDVQFDPGSGSFASVGTIPSDGAWTQYDFSVTTDPSGTTYFRVLDTNASIGTIYLDSVVLRESWFEYAGVLGEDLSGSPDGQILNDDEFHSGSYSFTVGDVDRYICVWDPTNVGNSGVYRITGVNGTDAIMDLRAGGTPALTAQTGLRWRLVDTAFAPSVNYNNSASPETQRHSGWGLESPHSEKWRFFMRGSAVSTNSADWLVTWSAPYDVDFNVENGNFDSNALSLHQYAPVYAKTNHWVGRGFCGYNWSGIPDFQRLYLQTDDDGSYLYMVMRAGNDTKADTEGTLVVGFSGADSYHTLRESFVHFGKQATDIAVDWSMYWDDSNYQRRVPYNGVQVVDENGFRMARCVWMCLGFGSGTASNKHAYTPPRSNPFGDEIMMYRPRLARDYDGWETGKPTEKVVTAWGIWESIPYANNWVGVDSNQYFHLSHGVFMEMPSSGGVGLFEPLA